MGKIVSLDQINHIPKNGQIIVLVGGCFDIIHIAHIEFLKRSKALGNILVVLLESDISISRSKGQQRPFNTQEDRAALLSHLNIVDYVIPLPLFTRNAEYLNIVKSIKPDIIAVTSGDPIKLLKEKHAESVNATVVEVIERKNNYSTSLLVEKIKKDNT